MADKLDLVFKKIVNREYTTTAKEWYEEFPGIPFKLKGSDVWTGDIPSTPPASGTSTIEIHNTLTLQEDITVNNQRSWLAEYPVSTRIGDFITPRYGQGYTVRVYDGSNVEIPTTDGSSWFFDYELGILTFDNDPGGYGWDDSAFKIKAYRYIGQTADDLSTFSGTLSASQIINDSTVSGASVKDALEWLDNNKVDYEFLNNTISGTGSIYAGDFYGTFHGDGSDLTGITASGVTSSGVDVSKFKYNQYLSTVSGTQVFSLPDSPVDNTVQIYINGLLQEPGIGNDYTISGQIVTFALALEVNDILLASYIEQ